MRYIFPYPIMKTKNNGGPAGFIQNVMRMLIERITQNPEFYNIKHYRKGRIKNRK